MRRSRCGEINLNCGRFQEGMREFGYVEGRDYAFESRYADGDFARLPLLAEELVRLKPDVIIAGNTSAALAIRQSTTNIPIVVGSMNDPVGSGPVVSEARPGTNVTGMRTNLEGLPGKQLEAGGVAGDAGDEISPPRQTQNREVVGYRRSGDCACSRRRGDRVNCFCCICSRPALADIVAEVRDCNSAAATSISQNGSHHPLFGER
jgi:hypothetical protein